MRDRVNTPADEIWASGPTHRKIKEKNNGTSEAEHVNTRKITCSS